MTATKMCSNFSGSGVVPLRLLEKMTHRLVYMNMFNNIGLTRKNNNNLVHTAHWPTVR